MKLNQKHPKIQKHSEQMRKNKINAPKGYEKQRDFLNISRSLNLAQSNLQGRKPQKKHPQKKPNLWNRRVQCEVKEQPLSNPNTP